MRVADPIRAKDKRLPYDDGQLRQIFTSYIYTTEAESYRYTAKYWVPLIGLYGLRLNEIVGLRVADVQTMDGILCLVIRPTEDKSLKTLASERIVPVPESLKGGILALVDHRKGQGQHRLFPEVRKDARGLYSHEFSKWWGRHAKSVGFSRKRSCLHSLRHNFRQAMREARIEEEVVLALGGWTPSGKSNVQRNYGSGVPISILKEAMEAAQFPGLNFHQIIGSGAGDHYKKKPILTCNNDHTPEPSR